MFVFVLYHEIYHSHQDLDYTVWCVLLFVVTQRYNCLMRVQYFTKKSHLCFIVSEQPIEVLLVKFELMSKTILHCVTPDSNMH